MRLSRRTGCPQEWQRERREALGTVSGEGGREPGDQRDLEGVVDSRYRNVKCG